MAHLSPRSLPGALLLAASPHTTEEAFCNKEGGDSNVCAKSKGSTEIEKYGDL